MTKETREEEKEEEVTYRGYCAGGGSRRPKKKKKKRRRMSRKVRIEARCESVATNLQVSKRWVKSRHWESPGGKSTGRYCRLAPTTKKSSSGSKIATRWAKPTPKRSSSSPAEFGIGRPGFLAATGSRERRVLQPTKTTLTSTQLKEKEKTI